jgi:hypothetical protein
MKRRRLENMLQSEKIRLEPVIGPKRSVPIISLRTVLLTIELKNLGIISRE